MKRISQTTSPLYYTGIDESVKPNNNEHDDTSHSSDSQLSRRYNPSNFDINKRKCLVLLLCSILIISISVLISVYMSKSSIESSAINCSPNNSNNTTLFSLSNLVLISPTTTTDTINVNENQLVQPLLYKSKINNNVYLRIPNNWINNPTKEFLFVQQITSGLGTKELFWDQGAVINQIQFQFEIPSSSFTTNNKLFLSAYNLAYRDNEDKYIQQSFTPVYLYAFDILDTTNSDHGNGIEGVLIDITDFILVESLEINNNDFSKLMATMIDSELKYAVDHKIRSYINTNKSFCKNGIVSIEASITYKLIENSPYKPFPTKFSTTIPIHSLMTTSIRNTFLLLPSFVHWNENNDHSSSSSTPTSTSNVKTTTTTTTTTTTIYNNNNNPRYHRRLYHPKSGFNAISFNNEYTNVFAPRDQHYIVRHALGHSFPSQQQQQHIDSTEGNNNNNKDNKREKIFVRSDQATKTKIASFNSYNNNNRNINTKINTESMNHKQSEEKLQQVKPQLIYYIDPATPPEYHSCLMQGILWWDEAFQYVSVVAVILSDRFLYVRYICISCMCL